MIEREKVKENNATYEEIYIIIEEVQAAISLMDVKSAPSPTEKKFGIMIFKGGDTMAECLHYLFCKCWNKGCVPKGFKLGPKIMLPKPSKEDYNTTKSYRPITLESIIGKLMEIIVKRRLVWKLEVEDGLADTQNAYRNNRTCTQSLMRAIQCIQEGMVKKQSSVMVVIDYESCFESVWRAGLLKKAHAHGVNGRLWMYLNEFLTDRQYYLRVNNYTSPIFSSKVGIPKDQC